MFQKFATKTRKKRRLTKARNQKLKRKKNVCERLRQIAEQTDGVQMQKLLRWVCQMEANRKKR